MKITRRQLRQIINEEVSEIVETMTNLLSEGLSDLYSKAGMKLPSRVERKKVAIFLKMKGAEGYAGSESQNIELEKLIKTAGGPKKVHEKMNADPGSGKPAGVTPKPVEKAKLTTAKKKRVASLNTTADGKKRGFGYGSKEAYTFGFIISAKKSKLFSRKIEKREGWLDRNKAVALMKTQVKAGTKRDIQDLVVSMWQKSENPKGSGQIGVRMDVILSPGEPLPSSVGSDSTIASVENIARQAIAKMAGVKANNLEIVKMTHRQGDTPIAKHLSW